MRISSYKLDEHAHYIRIMRFLRVDESQFYRLADASFQNGQLAMLSRAAEQESVNGGLPHHPVMSSEENTPFINQHAMAPLSQHGQHVSYSAFTHRTIYF